MKTLLCLVTGGAGDEQRARRLTGSLNKNRRNGVTSWDIAFYSVDRTMQKRQAYQDIEKLLQRRWDLVYLEGTGIAAGIPLIRAALSRGQDYVVSSGDSVSGFFRNKNGLLAGIAFEQYERMLYGCSSGFIGWTPYLSGIAIKMGAPRAVTVEGAVDLDVFKPVDKATKEQYKEYYNIPKDHLVCGVVGSLVWNPRQSYCYGLELVETLSRLTRQDVSILIVGDGTGRMQLEKRIPAQLRHRVLFTGRLQPNDVVKAMNAMDIGFITQTMDLLGSGRLTTKLPEYLACGLPIAMSPIPGYYDYVGQAGWTLPPYHPASEDFHETCAQWLDAITHDEIQERSRHTRAIAEARFDYGVISNRFSCFIHDVIDTKKPMVLLREMAWAQPT